MSLKIINLILQPHLPGANELTIKPQQSKIKPWAYFQEHNDGLAQDCSNSIANALELPQSCAELSMLYSYCNNHTKVMRSSSWLLGRKKTSLTSMEQIHGTILRRCVRLFSRPGVLLANSYAIWWLTSVSIVRRSCCWCFVCRTLHRQVMNQEPEERRNE